MKGVLVFKVFQSLFQKTAMGTDGYSLWIYRIVTYHDTYRIARLAKNSKLLPTSRN